MGLRSLSGLAAVLLAGSAVASPSITGLGDLPGGGDFSIAMAVSNNGTVVVGYSDDGSYRRAFRWSSGTGMVALPVPATGSGATYAVDVTPDGSVIVGHRSGFNVPLGDRGLLRWTDAGVELIQDGFPGGYASHESIAVSDDVATLIGSQGNRPLSHRRG